MSINCKCECSAAPKLIFACSGAADVGECMKMILKYCANAALSLCLLTLTACGRDKTTEKTKRNAEVATTEQKLPKLLDLGAHKCIPCKKMEPILEELTKEYKGVLNVEFIDVWLSENKAKAKSFGIQSIPTQIFFDADGKELWRHVGFISKKEILSKWKELGYDVKPAKEVKSGDEAK